MIPGLEITVGYKEDAFFEIAVRVLLIVLEIALPEDETAAATIAAVVVLTEDTDDSIPREEDE